MTRDCPACGSPATAGVLDLPQVPVHGNLLHATRAAARACRRGSIRLRQCASCNLVWNAAFDPSLLSYGADYDNTQTCSSVYAGYLRRVVRSIIARHGLRGKRVVEVGCGQGDFLELLCGAGDNTGIGFDPAFRAEGRPASGRTRYVTERFPPEGRRIGGDLVCCRHVLEHIARPRPFVEDLGRAVKDGRIGALYVEVPDLRWILRHRALWDICYEHCNYFTAASLARLFELSGFEVLRSGTAFAGQYMWLEARRSTRPATAHVREARSAPTGALVEFGRETRRVIRDLGQRVSRGARHGRRVVVWGGASKGVTFLNLLGAAASCIRAVVDVNPRKQGCYIAGTGHAIIAPDQLPRNPPASVWVMNPRYRREVQRDLARMGLHPRLHVVDFAPRRAGPREGARRHSTRVVHSRPSGSTSRSTAHRA